MRVITGGEAGPRQRRSSCSSNQSTHHTVHCLGVDVGMCICIRRHAQILIGLLRSAIEAVVHGDVLGGLVVVGELSKAERRLQDSAVPRDFKKIMVLVYKDTG